MATIMPGRSRGVGAAKAAAAETEATSPSCGVAVFPVLAAGCEVDCFVALPFAVPARAASSLAVVLTLPVVAGAMLGDVGAVSASSAAVQEERSN